MPWVLGPRGLLGVSAIVRTNIVVLSVRNLTDDDRKETNNVKDEKETLDERQLLSQGRVEEDGERSDCNDKKRAVPGLLAIYRVVVVVQSDQSLDDRAGQESDGGDGCLPSGETEPSDNVRQESLAAGR